MITIIMFYKMLSFSIRQPDCKVDVENSRLIWLKDFNASQLARRVVSEKINLEILTKEFFFHWIKVFHFCATLS
jgi:hypothetical protein